MNSLDEILNEDNVKHCIDELCEDIENFEQVDFVHILWARKDKKVKGRYYGELDTLLANLTKAQYLLLSHEAEGDIEL